jgi:hypothetical protein
VFNVIKSHTNFTLDRHIKQVTRKIANLQDSVLGNLHTGEGDLPLVQSSIHKKLAISANKKF